MYDGVQESNGAIRFCHHGKLIGRCNVVYVQKTSEQTVSSMYALHILVGTGKESIAFFSCNQRHWGTQV